MAVWQCGVGPSPPRRPDGREQRDITGTLRRVIGFHLTPVTLSPHPPGTLLFLSLSLSLTLCLIYYSIKCINFLASMSNLVWFQCRFWVYFEPCKFFPVYTQRLTVLCLSGFKLDYNSMYTLFIQIHFFVFWLNCVVCISLT